MELKIPPIKPINGRVCIQPVPYKPSKSIEVLSCDNADVFEGYVTNLSECQILPVYSRVNGKKKLTGHMKVPHVLKVGDRVIFKPQYLRDDFIRLNGTDYRLLPSEDIYLILEADRPEGFVNPLTDEVAPETPQTMILHH